MCGCMCVGGGVGGGARKEKGLFLQRHARYIWLLPVQNKIVKGSGLTFFITNNVSMIYLNTVETASQHLQMNPESLLYV